MAGGGGNKKRFQYCTDSSGQEILHLRALQGHSGRNPTDPTLQDNVTRLCINERRAVCSVLRVVHVHVRDSVYVIHRVWLKHDVVVRKVVRSVVAII